MRQEIVWVRKAIDGGDSESVLAWADLLEEDGNPLSEWLHKAYSSGWRPGRISDVTTIARWWVPVGSLTKNHLSGPCGIPADVFAALPEMAMEDAESMALGLLGSRSLNGSINVCRVVDSASPRAQFWCASESVAYHALAAAMRDAGS